MSGKILLIVLLVLLLLGGCFSANSGSSWFGKGKKAVEEVSDNPVAKISGWIIPALIFGIVVAVGSMINGSKSAGAWIIACVIGIVATILSQAAQAAIIKYPLLVGGAVILIPVGWFVYSGFLQDKGFLVFRKMIRRKK